MIESIAPIATGPAQAGAASPVADPKASAHDVRDFSASVDRAKASGEAAGQATGPAAVEQAPPPSEGLRSMLTAFDNLNGGANSIRDVASKLSTGGSDFSPSTVIELTMECHKFMFQTQLTSNVANRTSDGIQQLFRQQS